jgi:purine-binding chemotaxis protein CheW
MVQYREQLMPLVQMAGVTVQTSGSQPILVFADDGRSMGLVVDEIIDIVEERLHIEVAGSQEGILGSAVIKGQATEVIDVGHFLPMAFADWFSRKEMRSSATSQSVLLVDDSAFFRNMLAPVLKAAGYKVRTAPTAQEGLAALRSQTFDVVLTDIDRHERVRIRRNHPKRPQSEPASDHRVVGDGVAGGDRARAAGRLPRLCREIRPSRPDRGAEGTDRRYQESGMKQAQPDGMTKVQEANSMTTKTDTIEGTMAEYVTAVIGGQLFGLPISRVQDVFMPERLTRVPLSSGEIAGVLNLRGRIVTVVDMRARLGLPKADDGKPPMAVGVDLRGESYGLLIDQIGEVLRLSDDGREENPVNLDPRMAKLAGGVHRLDGQLMVVLDVDRVLELMPRAANAA